MKGLKQWNPWKQPGKYEKLTKEGGWHVRYSKKLEDFILIKKKKNLRKKDLIKEE